MKRKTRERIVEAAMTAPNVDNAQPFFFRWEGERLLVFRDEGRDRRRGNAGNYVSMVGLGCLGEYAAIAATGAGHEADLDFCYEAHDQSAPWLAISFRPTSADPDPLVQGLRLRCSDRREYQGGDLLNQVFRQVAADAEQFRRSRLYLQAPSDPRLLDYLLHSEAFFWADKHILPEMLSWVRWSETEVRRTRDGVPWQSMGVSFLTSRVMRLVARSGRFRQLLRRSGGPLRAQQKALEANVLSSAALGCITVPDTQVESMFELGRLFVRAWVRLNMAGFGVQVMANPAIHVFQHIAGILPDDYPDASKQVFAGGESILAEAFGLPTNEIPAWMFRTGKSSPLPEAMRTLRLPLSRVLRSDADEATAREVEAAVEAS